MLKLSAVSSDIGEADDELPIRYVGDSLDIGFNAGYLLDALRNIPGDEIRMSFKAPERAALLEPEGVAGPGSYVCLVMPLRLLD
jgi:DNA polymerase III subunit beta